VYTFAAQITRMFDALESARGSGRTQ
jgi:hypothetical protein